MLFWMPILFNLMLEAMKKYFLFLFWATLSGSCLMAQDMLTITLDASQLQNPDCWLDGGAVANDKVYFHSGLCTSNPTFCNDSIQGFNSPIWEHVTGNWGMDDGVGEMTFLGNATWEIKIDLETYHGAPMGSTPYTMGLVFRNLDGTAEGKDNQCGDIFIRNLNTSNPSVIQGSTGAPMTGVTAVKTVTGIEESAVLASLSLFPNPSQGQVGVRYQLKKPAQDFSATVYNSLGQIVEVLVEGKQAPGQQTLEWQTEATGIFYVVLKDGAQVLGWEKVIVQ